MEYIQYGTTRIEFEVYRSKRETLGINVYPDKSVSILAPESAEMRKIKEKVRKRAGWIVRQMDFFRSIDNPQTKREYVSGETHRYLGRQYRLKLVNGSGNDVKLKGRYFYISLKDKNDNQQAKQMLLKWYYEHATKKFKERLEVCHRLMMNEGIEFPQLELRKMKTRWGSCTTGNKILLNPELIKAPVHCIDYVIIHELCHLKVHNHSRAFYELKKKYLPDWEKRKFRLSQY